MTPQLAICMTAETERPPTTHVACRTSNGSCGLHNVGTRWNVSLSRCSRLIRSDRSGKGVLRIETRHPHRCTSSHQDFGLWKLFRQSEASVKLRSTKATKTEVPIDVRVRPHPTTVRGSRTKTLIALSRTRLTSTRREWTLVRRYGQLIAPRSAAADARRCSGMPRDRGHPAASADARILRE